MNLRNLLAKINEEVKHNPKVLDFDVLLQQYDTIECNDDGTSHAIGIQVKPRLYRSDNPIIVIM